MSPLDLLTTGLGLGLIVAGQLDLFLTVLHSEGYGPLSRALYRAGWSVLRTVAGVLPDRFGQELLGLGGALLLLATLAMWIGLQWFGFALLYLPGMHLGEFSLDPGVEPSFLDALYMSGVTLSTLGFGDVTPTAPVYQLASVIEGLSGFSILTLSISYILSVYRVLAEQRVLGAELNDFSNETGEPLVMARVQVRSKVAQSHLLDLHADVLRYNEGLHRFPIVYYFRPSAASRSLPYVVALLAEAIADLRWGLPPDHDIASAPSVDALVVALRRLTGDVGRRFVHEFRQEAEPGANAEAGLRDRYQEVVRSLAEVAGREHPSQGFDERRNEWIAFVAMIRSFTRAAAGHLGYPDETMRTLTG